MAKANDVAKFIRELKKQGDFETWADFAREAGVLTSSLSNWQMGNIEASGANLLKLIWASERSREAALHRAAMATDPKSADAQIAAYHELVAALGLQHEGVSDPRQIALSATAAGLVSEIREHLDSEFSDLDERLARLEAAQVPAQQPRVRKAKR